jgi:N-carbamoyl-L-amino-acid hydrolase
VNDRRPPVDIDRLRRDIERNAQFGAAATQTGHGRTVLPGTEANRSARDHLVDRMAAADLAVDVDAVGNIVGRWEPAGCDPAAPAVASGSHLDSVPDGGIFDGPLGVYGALEAVRAMQAAEVSTERPVEVVCFTGEEGTRFGDGVLGSSVAAGALDTEAALASSDGEVTLGEALAGIGFRGEGRLDASGWDAWLELHVEQGRRLERQGVPAGVVTSIAGTTRLHVTVDGAANHSGTTPMDERTDALAAASELVLELEEAGRTAAATGDGTAVTTVGALSVEPGAVNVVPGRVELEADVRDVEAAVVERLVGRVETTVERLEGERGVSVELERPYDIPPTPMSGRCREALRAAGESTGVGTVDLHSGAGHDTMQVARVTDAGMLFAPSEGGASHNPAEWTSWQSCAATTEVLAVAIGDLAGAYT